VNPIRTTAFLCALLAAAGASAQDARLPGNSLHLATGITQLKEEILHGKAHRGAAFELGYRRVREQRQLRFWDVSLRFARPKTRLEEGGASIAARLQGSYHVLFALRAPGANTSFWLGPVADVRYNLGYYPRWDDSHYYWANLWTLGASAVARRQFSPERSLLLSVRVPVAGALSRPPDRRPYKISPLDGGGVLAELHSAPELAWWGRAFFAELEATYTMLAGKRLRQNLFYKFDYQRVQAADGRPVQSLGHVVGLQWQWR
jgi:hypothetical protein